MEVGWEWRWMLCLGWGGERFAANCGVWVRGRGLVGFNLLLAEGGPEFLVEDEVEGVVVDDAGQRVPDSAPDIFLALPCVTRSVMSTKT